MQCRETRICSVRDVRWKAVHRFRKQSNIMNIIWFGVFGLKSLFKLLDIFQVPEDDNSEGYGILSEQFGHCLQNVGHILH